MTALVISVGTTTRTLPHPTIVGATVDHDVPDLQLPLRIGYVDPPGAATHLHIAYFRGGGSMILTPIEPGLWWAVAGQSVDVARVLGHLSSAVKRLHTALMDSERGADAIKLADRLAAHASGQWREELAVERDDTSPVVGIRGPGVAGGRARDVALSGQDLGTDEQPKAPIAIHARRARKLAAVAAVEIGVG